MRVVTYWQDGELRTGVSDGRRLRDAGPLASAGADGEAWGRLRGSGDELELSRARLGPSLLVPGKLICIGLNYRKHAEESGAPVPETPVIFGKFANTLAAAGQEIRLPATAEQYDYEAELGVVIGRRCRDVDEARALDHVFGYCCCNDVSARDLQFRSTQWMLGKTLDGFLPVGPELVSADEAGDPQRLRIECRVNGEVRQASSTGDMIFSVAEIVSYLSRYMTLEPGDLIATGTPEGVGMASKRWLRAGDVVEVEIERLGVLSNRMAQESSTSRAIR